MTTDQKEAAVQRLAAAFARAYHERYQLTMGKWLHQTFARIAIEQGVEKIWDASSSHEYPIPWDAVCPEEKP